MNLFLGVHRLPPGFTDQDARQGFAKYKESAKEAGLEPISAVFSIEKGFAYCQTEANSVQEVWDAHKKVEIPLEDVIRVEKIT